ncbi:MAG: hypothetical protein RJA36_915 [Pseudomonadota bacterium]|jgi:uncharacterized protein YfdQ (DUF2303 family)
MKPFTDTINALRFGTLSEELTKKLPKPTRKKGLVKIRDLESFVRQVNKHKVEGLTEIYRTVNPPRFSAVINDHGAGEDDAGWGDHWFDYECPLSAEWKTWTGNDSKRMTQEQFAVFIEDNLPDIVEPVAAHMLEIATTLEAKKKVNFASGIRLSNGQNEFTYEESIQGTAGKGKIQVPETFKIGIAVFEGGPAYAVNARLRYRINDGLLQLWYDLERPHKIIEDAADELRRQVEEKTGITTINGTRHG